MACVAPFSLMFFHEIDYVPLKPFWDWREHFGPTTRLHGRLEDLRKPKAINGIPKLTPREFWKTDGVWSTDNVKALLDQMEKAQWEAFFKEWNRE